MTILITLLMTFALNGINYSIVDDEATVARTPDVKGEVTIPTSVKYQGNTYFVTGIADSAFYDCYDMTAITLPKNIDRIGSFAFFNTGLTKPVYTKNIFAYLPYDFKGEYKLPSGITEIAGGAFCGCGDLTSVVLPSKLSKIGGYAFFGTSVKTPVMTSSCFAYLPAEYKGRFVIPAGVTTIAAGAFNDCEQLTRVVIPKSVTTIGAGAFANCFNLDSVFIPSGVTAIESRTFEQCGKLILVTLPSHLDHIGDRAFAECIWLSNIDFSRTQIQRIGFQAFYDCRALQRIKLLEGLLSIGEGAFAQCNDLHEANIPQSVTSVGIQAFAHTKVAEPLFSKTLFVRMPEEAAGTYTIPDGITTILPYAFAFCQKLEAVVIPASVTYIGELAFQYSSIKSANVPAGAKVAENAFLGCRFLNK